MELLTRHPYVTATVIGVVAVAIALLVPVGGSGGSDDEDRPTARPSVYGPSLGPERVAASDDDADDAADADADSGTAEGSESVSMGLAPGGLPPGLAGDGQNLDIPYLEVEMIVTSPKPIGAVGYQVPTSPDDQAGIAKNVGTSWKRTMKAWGKPDYAQLFLQAGSSGAPITCIIKVDGKVTEKRTSSGPYAQLFCQG